MSNKNVNITNLSSILTDLHDINKFIWNELSSHQIKTFSSSDSIIGSITDGALTLDVNISNFVANDITNALTVRTSTDGNPGLYVGLPIATSTTYGLVKPGAGISISDGVISVDAIKINENDQYLTSSIENGVTTIGTKNIGENSETTNYLTGKTIVWDGLRALDTAIKSVADSIPEVPEVPVYSIKKAATANTGYAATYNLTKDGVITGDSIDIIKDQFLKNAEIITATADDKANDDSVVVDGTYIKFTFELSNDNDVEGEETSTKVIYLDASTLVNKDQLSQVIKVSDISTYDTSTLGRDALLFTEQGETAIYDATSNTLRDCSEETVDAIANDTSIDLVPNVGAVTGYIDAIKGNFGTANISGVVEIPESYTSDKNTLLFTANGETAIYDAASNTVIDCSEKIIEEICEDSTPSGIPTVDAITGYFETFNEQLADLQVQINDLKSQLGIEN